MAVSSSCSVGFADEEEADNIRYYLTFVAFLLALSSGTLYAWACLSEEVEAHFGWSHEAATDIFSLGFVGEFVPAFTFGLVLKHYGPQVGTAMSTALVSATYAGIFLQTVLIYKVWILFALLHAVMGYGSIGFYFCSLYIAGSLWPTEMSGKVLGLMAATYAGSGAVTAQIYKLSGSLETYYCTLTVLCFGVGIFALVGQRKWPIPRSRSQPPSPSTSQRDESARYGSTDQASADKSSQSLSPHAQSAYAASTASAERSDTIDMQIDINTRFRGQSEPALRCVERGSTALFAQQEFHRRPTFAADQVIHQSTNVFDRMYGPVMPETETPFEVVTWSKILTAAEFWTLLATFLCLNGTSLMIVAQLDTLKHMMGVNGVHTETLVILYQVSDCCARLLLAVISDATAQTIYFRRNFYVIVANGFMVLALNLLLWGSSSPSLTLLVCVCMCGGAGNGSSSMIGPVIVRQTFGTQWIGIVLGLMKACQALSNVAFGKFFVYSTADTTYPTTKYIASVKVSLCLVCSSLTMAAYIWYKSVLKSQQDEKK